MKAEKAVTQNIKRYISNTLKNIQMSYLWSSQKEEEEEEEQKEYI